MIIGQIAAQKRKVLLAPGGDAVIVVAIGHRAADDQQQHLAKRMRHAPGIARIGDKGEVVEKRRKTRFLFKDGEGKAHAGGSRINPPKQNHAFDNPLTGVNQSSEPCTPNPTY